MELIINKNVFNEAYFPFLLEYSKRYEIWYGGAGSGKSHFLAQKLIIKAINDKRKILCLRKVDKTVANSVFQILKEQLSFFHLLDKCKVNKSNYSIELPNGSIFLCTGLQDVERLKSTVGITDVWLEEATEMIQDDFNQLDLRLRHPTASAQTIYLSFNPVSKVNWCYKLFFNDEYEDENQKQELEKFREKCEIHKTTYQDNRFLPQAYVDSLLSLRATNPAYFTIYALGEFGSLSKLVYTNWQSFEFNHKDINGELICGLDWGFTNDTTAFIASLLVEEEKRIYIFQEWGDTGLVNSEIADKIKELGFSKSTIIADSAEQKSIEEVKREGLIRIKPSVKGAGSILQGIQKLQQYELIVHPSCRKTLEELKAYCWRKDKKTNEYVNEPEDRNNHFLDALRYSLQCVNESGRVQFIDKNFFI